MCPAPELREVPVRARDGERGHVGGEPLPAGPQAPQLRHGAAGVGGPAAPPRLTPPPAGHTCLTPCQQVTPASSHYDSVTA